MNTISLLGHSAQLLRIVRKSPQPADLLTSSYMRDRKYIGAKDRRIISAVVFLSMRCLGTSDELWAQLLLREHLSGASDHPDHGSVLCTLLLSVRLGTLPVLKAIPELAEPESQEVHVRSLAIAFAQQILSCSLEEATNYVDVLLRLYTEATAHESLPSTALQACLPVWIVERWVGQGNNASEIVSLGRSLLHPAPLTVRVQTMLNTPDAVMQQLKLLGIAAHRGRLSPHAIVLAERQQLQNLDLYRHGLIEVQDESSQLVAFALDPEPQARILDACCGAGGKSLHLACMQSDHGFIQASDLEAKRMRELGARAQRAHLHSIQIAPLHQRSEDERMRLQASFDYVLIDAPCTGMGTVRRSPMLKWRLTADSLDRMTMRQTDILDEYARYVKPGGVLVYVTCSLMREENDIRVDEFLRTHDQFVADSIGVHFPKHGIHLPATDGHCVSLDPYHHGSDGFFIARMRRRE